MTIGYHGGQIFLSDPHTTNGFFFMLTTKYLILYWKYMNKTSNKSWLRWDVTWWGNCNITMTSRIDVRQSCGRRSAVRFLSFTRAGTAIWEKWNPSLVFSGDRKILTRGPSFPVGNEACRVSQWTMDPRVGIFLEPLNDRFFFSYSVVLYFICWWRPWGCCLQSMTRAVQITWNSE